MTTPIEAEHVKKAKSRLRLVGKIDRLINNKLREIDRLKEIAISVSNPLSPNLARSSNDDKMGTIITKIIDYQEDVAAQIDYYIDLKKQIVAEIESIESVEAMQLLYLKYIDGKTWKEIEIDMQISRAWMFRLHGIALIKYGSRL
nr:MAG TPA: Protein of unknown function (DUF1492) [Caudoviricetes sp.]